ncbi:unnamed protein product [Discosporangium mesarthrocarpum]
MPSWGWGYGQRAVVATVRLSGPHSSTAFQRYLSDGPLAMLPLGGGVASLVWSTTPAQAERLKKMPAEDFLHAVNKALQGSAPPHPTSGRGPRPHASISSPPPSPQAAAEALANSITGGLEGIARGLTAATSLVLVPEASPGAAGAATAGGGEGSDLAFEAPPEAVEVLTSRLGFDLSLRQAYRYTGQRTALIGDAAHTIHPMAGQGLNLGLADAEALANVIEEGVMSGSDLGSMSLLQRYEQERKGEALLMMGTLDALHRLFGNDSRGISALRSAGLSALNALGPLKQRLAAHAMGGGRCL